VSEASSTVSDAGLSTRLLRAGETLVRAHADRAKQEASADVSRIVSGVVTLALALLLGAIGLAVLELAALFALRELGGWRWLHAALAVAAANLLVGATLTLVGRARLKRPILAETRKTLHEAIGVLLG
jgi:hypothetical protein